jgi:electron transport complex protein RnfG
MPAMKMIRFIAILVFLATGLAAFAGSVDWPRLLGELLPEANRFSQLSGSYKAQSLTLAIFPAYRGEEQIGVIFYAAPEGYSGKLHTLVAVDMQGSVKRVKVFSHTETPSWVVPLDDGSFLRQFEGVSLLDKMALLIGARPGRKGEIAAITGSTITSKPIAIAVSEARKLFVEIYPGGG